MTTMQMEHVHVHGDDTKSDDAVLLLVCGLPGAGKSTLARHVAVTAHTSSTLDASWCVELLSFDDLFFNAASSGNDSEFDPAVWKRCQRSMTEHVRTWRHSAQTEQPSDASRRQLVLLVDDNFQYRSLRKRFAHLAAELDCGFGVLHVDTPVELCRERNAARSGAERVSSPVFERMVRVFEAPNGDKHEAFERNARAVAMLALDTDALCAVSDVVAALVYDARTLRRETRRLAALTDASKRQRAQDHAQTQRDVAHRVDLALRKWISSALTQAGSKDSSSSSRESKAERAKRLNEQRKAFLLKIKALETSSYASSRSSSDDQSINAVVAAHVERFQEQQQQ